MICIHIFDEERLALAPTGIELKLWPTGAHPYKTEKKILTGARVRRPTGAHPYKTEKFWPTADGTRPYMSLGGGGGRGVGGGA